MPTLARTVLGLVALVLASTGGAAGAAAVALRTPPGSGPFPTIVMVPTCEGFTGIGGRVYTRFGETYVGEGFAVATLDYLTPRGFSVCSRGRPPERLVSLPEVAGDLYRMIDDLQRNPAVDPAQISLLGYSYGGSAVLEALSGTAPARAKIHAVIAYYPECRGIDPWRGSTPVLIFLGGADTVAPPAECRAFVATMANGSAIKTIEFPGAMHAFNFSVYPRAPGIDTPFGPVAYDPGAARRAHDAVLQLLKP